MSRLFDDKPRNYTKPSRRAETTYSFLDRSSLPEYERVRCMLQRWVDRFPLEHQPKILGEMRHKGSGSIANDKHFNAAFFELFLHEFLNGTDGSVEVQPSLGSRPPDFRVKLKLQDKTEFTYIVEASDIDLESGTALERDQNELSVFDVLNEIPSPDFFLFLETRGKLESTPPLRKLKHHFEKLIKEADYDDLLRIYMHCGQNPIHLPTIPPFPNGNWILTGRLIPVLPESRPNSGKLIRLYPSKVSHIDDIGKTKARLDDKAKQHRNVENLVIALRCDPANDRLDEALIGKLGPSLRVHREKANSGSFHSSFYNRRKDGFWANNSGPQNQNVIGVVAFYDLHPWTIGNLKAMFYSNPYVDKPMPDWTKSVTHAEYSDGEVTKVEGTPPFTFMGDYEVIGNPFG